jgi:hypothetical protein
MLHFAKAPDMPATTTIAVIKGAMMRVWPTRLLVLDFRTIASEAGSDLARIYILEHITAPLTINTKAAICDSTVAKALSITAKKIEITFITEFNASL